MSKPASHGLQLFNTLTGKLEPFVPLDPAGKKVKMYVCGPTVYDDAHLGHARCYITWDVLYRFLKFLGYDVTYVRNVTDVDDKILNRAKERGESPTEVAERNYQSFATDMQALNVLPPDDEPRATQYIAQMIETIQGLVKQGAAYVTPDGTVYFRVEAKPDYGKLSKKPLDDLRAGARVEVDPHKESPLDFALWKHVSAEEQAQPGHAFESPWGKGRPGWHIECSAMNYACLGPQIDIHAGGADLIFPHHENEIAQTEAWLNLSGEEHKRFSKYWMHNGFVNVSGEKMSKSLGNFSTIKKILERYDANTIRHFLLTNKYRMPVDFNDEALESSKKWVLRIEASLKEVVSYLRQNNIQEPRTLIVRSKSEIDDIQKLIIQNKYLPQNGVERLFKFTNVMMNDLNAPQALASLNSVISTMNSIGYVSDLLDFNYQQLEMQRNLFTLASTILSILGFELNGIFSIEKIKPEQGKVIVEAIKDKLTFIDQNQTEFIFGNFAEDISSAKPYEEVIDKVIDLRNNAKSEKKWHFADRLRDILLEENVQIKDSKAGTTWDLNQK